MAVAAVAAILAAVAMVAPAPAGGAPGDRPRVADDVPVTPVDLVQVRANNSPALAVDPTEPRFVVLANRLDLPVFGCSLHLSGDGGRGWVAVDPVPTLPRGAERCYGPEVAFDAKGTLYFLFVGLAGAGNTPVGVYLTTSTNRGRSFSPPQRLLGADKFGVRMAIDPTLGRRGRIHLVWIDAGARPALGGFAPVANPIVAAHSDDGGRTFSAPVAVSDPDRARVVAPALAVGPDHDVHVAYYDLGADAVDYQGLEGPTWEGTWSLVTAHSSDAGGRFSPGVVVDDAVVPPERVMLVFTMPPPALAAGPGGRVYAAWYDARNGDWDVFLRRSGDGGRSWEAAVRLNDDALGNRRHQYLPRLGVAPGGRVDAVFYDRRDDPENLANHLSYTFSADGGATFSSNMRLSDLASSSRTGPRYPIPSAAGLIEFGSRLALVSGDDEAMAAWTDTRNSRPGQQQDVFATSVVFRERPAVTEGRSGGGGNGAAVVALVGGLGLLVLAGVAARRWRRAGAVPAT
ncbi:MAG: glycoside hydrolase, partial [Actinomycetota bacterium]|nr:glycoside hydrolase [Actinomycetota bacterium]